MEAEEEVLKKKAIATLHSRTWVLTLLGHCWALLYLSSLPLCSHLWRVAMNSVLFRGTASPYPKRIINFKKPAKENLPSPRHEQQKWAEKNIKEVWFHLRRNCEVILQQDISMIICDKKEKTAESTWLINSYTILYVLSGEREKKKTVSLDTLLLSHRLISGKIISLRSNSGMILPHNQKLGCLQLRSWYLARTFAPVHGKWKCQAVW